MDRHALDELKLVEVTKFASTLTQAFSITGRLLTPLPGARYGMDHGQGSFSQCYESKWIFVFPIHQEILDRTLVLLFHPHYVTPTDSSKPVFQFASRSAAERK
jgi:hypothetical protein